MNSVTIREVILHAVGLPLVEKLKTSYGAEPFKSAVIVELITADGRVGWGECPTKMRPSYAYETVATALHVLSEFLIPAVVGKTITTPTELPKLMGASRGHPMAKHALESAVWDVWAQANDMTLAEAFAAHLPAGHQPKGHAVVGVSIGIQESVPATLDIITKRLEQGYGRIKLKIAPGWDVELAREVRKVYPDITLMLDANSAYRLSDAAHLKQLDDLNLLMIEQPLGFYDIYEHSKLQPMLRTPVCLDESIHSAGDALMAIELGACKIINLKPARVAGYTESLEIYKICAAHNVPLWVGGLLETGVGRAANLAFASLPAVTLPCDISATDRYYQRDLTEPPFVLSAGSVIHTPTGVGLGVAVQHDRIAEGADYWRQHYPYRT